MLLFFYHIAPFPSLPESIMRKEDRDLLISVKIADIHNVLHKHLIQHNNNFHHMFTKQQFKIRVSIIQSNIFFHHMFTIKSLPENPHIKISPNCKRKMEIAKTQFCP